MSQHLKALFSLYLFSLCCVSYSFSTGTNKFHEELYIKPLPSGHIYSHFEFTTLWSTANIDSSISSYKNLEFIYFDLFPRALGEIIEKYHVRELHISLTQGLWKHSKWGYPIYSAPAGAQLWAWFNPVSDNLDDVWRNLVNALSGLFCASFNFIDSTNTVSPNLSYRPTGIADNCGLVTLLQPAPLYGANYHSLGIQFRPVCTDNLCNKAQIELVQSLSLVQDPTKAMDGFQDWSFKQLYNAPLVSACPLAETSEVFVDITENEDFKKYRLDPSPSTIEGKGSATDKRSLATYNVREVTSESLFNLQAMYSKKHIYGVIPSPPLTISRFISGYGQESGSITSVVTNNGKTELTVVFLEVLPWYLRLFFHSSQSRRQPKSLYVSKLVTASDRERGWLYEVVVKIPGSTTVEFDLHFTRALLKWLEYPPDANHGFYLPAATVSTVLLFPMNMSTNSLDTVTLRNKLKLAYVKSFLRIHSETLLVSLPTPDFSMPYNVICLACTVVALAFGPIHNITTKRLVLKKVKSDEGFLRKICYKFTYLFKKRDKEEVITEMNPTYCADNGQENM